jgi:hypothetical protein
MKADYGWVILVVVVVVGLLAWPVLRPMFTAAGDQLSNKDQYDRGKAVFYDGASFPQGRTDHSCAACHAADYKPVETEQISMDEYREGEPYPLSDLGPKYGSMLTSEDKLYDAVKRCLILPTRMKTGGMGRDVEKMEDLLAYVRREFK